MKKLIGHPLLMLFALFIFGTSVIDWTKPDRNFSEFENKILKEKPDFQMSQFVDGSFSSDYVEYINDQFIGRNEWISMKAIGEQCLGKTENNGIIFGKEHTLFEKLQLVENKPTNAGSNVVEKSKMIRSVKMVKEFFEKYELPITFAIVPNSSEILQEKLPVGFNRVNQETSIRKMYQQLEEKDVAFLDFYNALRAHKEEYIYYRTDHHWTSLGAYYAYEEYCSQKGLTPIALDQLQANTVENFYGTFYSKAKLTGIQPDTITWYDIPVKQFLFHADLRDTTITSKGKIVEYNGMQLLSVPGMYDESKFETRDKYAAMMWGNSGLTKIISQNNLNHEEGKTSRLLLIKDSYANSMIPYLTYNYDEIVVLDLRTIPKKLSQILSETEFTDIFVMYNFSTFISDSSNLANLRF